MVFFCNSTICFWSYFNYLTLKITYGLEIYLWWECLPSMCNVLGSIPVPLLPTQNQLESNSYFYVSSRQEFIKRISLFHITQKNLQVIRLTSWNSHQEAYILAIASIPPKYTYPYTLDSWVRPKRSLEWGSCREWRDDKEIMCVCIK
jgi:hypothetical protein